MNTAQAALTAVAAVAAALSAGAAWWAIREARAERREDRRARERQDIGIFVGHARSLLLSTEPPGGVVSIPEAARKRVMDASWARYDRLNEEAERIAGTYGSETAIGKLALEQRDTVLAYLKSLTWVANDWQEPQSQEKWDELNGALAVARAKADELESFVHSGC